jgi:lanosterol synthase
MIEHSYPECTTACESPLFLSRTTLISMMIGVTALSVFKRAYPDYRAADIERVSKAAISYIHTAQRPDGSWYGSWGIVSPNVLSLCFRTDDERDSASLMLRCSRLRAWL